MKKSFSLLDNVLSLLPQTMITHGESKIEKIVCIMSNGVVGGSPCGACRELIMQLHKDSKNIEILINK